MKLKITTALRLVKDHEDKAILEILLNNKIVGMRVISVPEGLMDDRYPMVMNAMGIAENSPLHTLSTTLQAQLTETINSIEINLPIAYEQVKKVK